LVNISKKSLEIDSNHESVWTNLGSAYYNTKQFDKAIKSLKKALEIVPDLKFTKKVLELAEKAKKANLRP